MRGRSVVPWLAVQCWALGRNNSLFMQTAPFSTSPFLLMDWLHCTHPTAYISTQATRGMVFKHPSFECIAKLDQVSKTWEAGLNWTRFTVCRNQTCLGTCRTASAVSVLINKPVQGSLAGLEATWHSLAFVPRGKLPLLPNQATILGTVSDLVALAWGYQWVILHQHTFTVKLNWKKGDLD